MVGKKKTDTYLFKSYNAPAYKIESDGKLERDEDGYAVGYDKESIMEIVQDLIDKRTISKGEKYETKQGKYDIYRFVYKVEDKEGKETKYALRVKVSNAYEEDNIMYKKQLDNFVEKAYKIRKVNIAKMILAGTAMTLMIGAATYGFAVAAEKEDREMAARNAAYVQTINDDRRADNLPPLDATYEDGRPFEGSYSDWAKYISGYTDQYGNVIADEEEPIKGRTN